MHVCSDMSDSVTPSLDCKPTRFLCSRNFAGENTGMGCHFLLQGIFPTQGSNPSLLSLLHWQANSFPRSHLGGKPHRAISGGGGERGKTVKEATAITFLKEEWLYIF